MTRRVARLGSLLPWLLAMVSLVMAPMASSQSLSVQPVKIAGTVSSADWEAYRSRFIEDSGRVVDTANGNISHSESEMTV
ncbi:MAG: endoglucanase [Microvirga sp.]|nr:endoglucanase [Microvirga sp.]